jgi:tetratricopeptide (TPR) repeat protein
MNDTAPLEKLSIADLRKAVVDEPRNAQLRHLLGAEMAQQQDYDGAVMEMSAAIALNPLMHVARFQLGLLHLTMSRPDHAIAVLSPLENLDDESALKHFKRGLEALIVDDFDNCTQHLLKGIELNRDLEPLNKDMQMLLERVKAAADSVSITSSPDPTLDKSIDADSGAVRTDFGLYNKNTH